MIITVVKSCLFIGGDLGYFRVSMYVLFIVHLLFLIGFFFFLAVLGKDYQTNDGLIFLF